MTPDKVREYCTEEPWTKIGLKPNHTKTEAIFHTGTVANPMNPFQCRVITIQGFHYR